MAPLASGLPAVGPAVVASDELREQVKVAQCGDPPEPPTAQNAIGLTLLFGMPPSLLVCSPDPCMHNRPWPAPIEVRAALTRWRPISGIPRAL